MFLIVFFTLNAGFSGTRLGLCWVMLEERFPEFRGEVKHITSRHVTSRHVTSLIVTSRNVT